jgi:nitrous oxide reductase accessory protein NosL
VRLLLLFLALLAAGCRKDEPAAPTAEQSAQLNDADRMLDNLANEEGPEASASGPSNSSD